MTRLVLLLSGLALTIAAQSVHARPPSKTKGRATTPKQSVAKTASTPDVVRMRRGTLRKAKGLPKLPAKQTLSKADAARVLGVSDGSLGTKVTLSPAQALVGTSFMRFFCPTTVHPDVPMARFSPSTYGGCADRTGVGVRFVARAGRRYLIDCAGTPGHNVIWTLRPRNNSGGGVQTVANTEHPAFIYEAVKDGEVALDFNANTDVFHVHRCEITSSAN